MRSLLRSLAITTAALLLTSAAVAARPGYADFGPLVPAEGHEFVEVELDGGLLKLASMFLDKHDPEIGKLVANLERVRVNVVGLDDTNRASTTERVEAVRRALAEQGWKRVVTVKEQQGGDVAVFLQQDAEGVIQGLVVTVIEGSSEAVFVNIVGEVRPEQVAAIGERLDLAPLRQLDLAAAK